MVAVARHITLRCTAVVPTCPGPVQFPLAQLLFTIKHISKRQHHITSLHMQALAIQDAVRQLNMLVATGKRVYIHCTAGINRAPLTVLAYMTNVMVRNCS